jgi:hypothetical protein
MTKFTTPRDRSQRWKRYLALAADAGEIAMSLRDKPTRLDWVAFAFRSAGFALRVGAERRRFAARDPWTYFDSGGHDPRWMVIPDEFEALVIEQVGDVAIEVSHWDGDSESSRVFIGRIGGEQIGWVGDREGDVIAGPYLVTARERETYRAVGERVWARLAGRHCVFGRGGLAPDPLAAGHHAAGAQVRELRDRLARFLDRGVHRSCLLVGPPGTGKSTGIRYLARELGLRSLRVDLSALARAPGVRTGGDEAPLWLETLLKLLTPELLILDDLDRVECGGELLHFLELAAATCRLVLASANATEPMMGAALRPGRFDEVVRVDRLDRDLLAALLGPEDADLAEAVADLPIAYVAEFVKRRGALGRDQALAELAELRARRALVEPGGAPNGQPDAT